VGRRFRLFAGPGLKRENPDPVGSGFPGCFNTIDQGGPGGGIFCPSGEPDALRV